MHIKIQRYLCVGGRGYTLVESLVAIGVVSLLILIFGTSYTIVTVNQNYRHKNLAYNLALEEIEALRDTPFENLTDRTNAAFINVAHNIGQWTVQYASDAPSPSYIYELESPTGNPSGTTGTAIIPGFDYTNFTFTAQVKIISGSPITSRAGLFYRYIDANNYYSTYFTATNLYVSKVVDGVESILSSKIKSFSAGTWYKLAVTATGTTFEIYVNDMLELSSTDAGESFSYGRCALYGANSANLQYDSASITEDSTLTWNFDADTLGGVAEGWQRFGIDDLPSGTEKLTIEDEVPGSSEIKKVTARVEWQEKHNTRFAEIVTLINEH
ncbi:MAG: hypothetical protein PHY34_01485 [Patescibacteria group bacterium]|nr:hypothetical protein [Patescibacteria group bacterium]MDD5715107.1 hypothetical protein [Patescibacteria group bacterium]